MNEQHFWDERYSTEEYLYGVEPNSFLANHVDLLAGPVLALSEGEGRNAVFLAERGLKVHCVDLSKVALDKAHTLAKTKGVEIETEVADLADFTPKENFYGSVISISAHLPSTIRKRLYPLVEKSLKPNGVIIFESYLENQLNRDTGGPKDIDMLMTIQKLRDEFPNLEPIIIQEIERDVTEGKGHTGIASVVQYIARKNA